MLDRILKFFRRTRPNDERSFPADVIPEIILDDLPTLELSEYMALVEEIPAPTDDQIRSFAAFVSDAKSWYKHLSLFGRTPFYFFVDPCAGLDRIWLSGEVVTFGERTESTPRFHYTWMTTADYRARFGCLSYCCGVGSDLFIPVSVELAEPAHASVTGILDNNSSYPVIYREKARPARLPQEVLDAGRANVTPVVHSRAASAWFWERAFSTAKGDVDWPEETGGAQTIANIRERCRSVRERAAAGGDGELTGAPDPQIDALVRPERDRLQMEMIAAMKRTRTLAYSGA